MISRYPDYFAGIPMTQGGIPIMPGYPMPDYRVDTDNSSNEKDYEPEDTYETPDESKKDKKLDEDQDNNSDKYEMDKTLTRQAPSQTQNFEMAPGSPIAQDINYTQGYLQTQIGKRVRITYLLGTGTLQDRTGVLKKVGISYVILRNEETNTDELSDIYSIKFVVIFD